MGYLLKGWCLVVLTDDVFSSSPLGLGISSTCHLPSWGMWESWPMVWAQSAFLMIPWHTISPSSFSVSSLYSMGTFRLPHCTGRTLGSVLMSYSPDMSPMQSKLLGNNAWRSLVLFNGCRSRLHCRWGWMSILLESGPLEGWSFIGCAVFAVWGSEITQLTSLTETMYLGLSLLTLFSRVLKEVNFWDPSSVVLKEAVICFTFWPWGLERESNVVHFCHFWWIVLKVDFYLWFREGSWKESQIMYTFGHGPERF